MSQRAEDLIDQGRAHLDAGRREEAERCFRDAAGVSPIPPALNNWALCRHLAGDHAGALRILAPLLGSAEPAPFSRALASLAQAAQGEREAAHRLLLAAIRDFDAGPTKAVPPPAWVEYTLIIKQAAGGLGEHRLLLDLHGRWPGRDLPLGAFCAGVAAFNLRKYVQAAKYWRRITDPEWDRLMAAHAQVADLAERGLVPPFVLEYDPSYKWDPKQQDAAAARELAARGTVRVRMLAYLFMGEAEGPAALVDALINATGPWGLDLGQRLLAGSTVPMSLKTGAAKALTEAGVFAPGQPIPVVHEGRSTSIVLKQTAVQADDPELERTVAEAKRLRDSGRRDEAYQLLSDLLPRGIAYPPAIMLLANLMRDRGELEGAGNLLDMLEKVAPDEPSVHFNLAGLWLQRGDVGRAREYAQRIPRVGLPPEFRQKLDELLAYLEPTELPDLTAMADRWREEVEAKAISPTVRLRAALRQIPVQWLNAAAALHQVQPARVRTERERTLAAVLREPGRAATGLAAEGPQVQAALRFLLAEGGWCKLSLLTRHYGSQDGDGFFWDEQPPRSPLGRLRALGLVYVGRTMIDGRTYKVAVVPADLRELLAGAR